MRVALGTGSTAAYAIRALAERFGPEGTIDAVATSSMSEELARQLGLPVRPLKGNDTFDIMIDGADEVTPRLELTKGGGAALFREKFLARLSREVVIVVDHTKLVDRLGSRSAIPIEVVPYSRPVLEAQLTRERFGIALRRRPDGTTLVTENGNEILDLRPSKPVEAPAELERSLRGRAGIVETGLFVGLAHRVFIGLPDDRVDEVVPPTGAPAR
jgi:ribose 5-phosphate isomerase A